MPILQETSSQNLTLADAQTPDRSSLLQLDPLHTIGQQEVFPERRGVSAHNQVVSRFDCGSVNVFTFRGDPIEKDERSLYVMIQAKEAPTGLSLRREPGNAMIVLRVATLIRDTRDSQFDNSEMLRSLGLPENADAKFARDEVNAFARKIEKLITDLQALDPDKSDWIRPLFGKNNATLDIQALSKILHSQGLKAGVKEHKNCAVSAKALLSLAE